MQNKLSMLAAAALLSACGSQNATREIAAGENNRPEPKAEVPQVQAGSAPNLTTEQQGSSSRANSGSTNGNASLGNDNKPNVDADVQCFGINSCSPYAKCAVTSADIEATKKVFGERFAQSEVHACAGLGKCAAQEGQLNWVQVSQKECTEAGGFLIKTNPAGNKEVIVL